MEIINKNGFWRKREKRTKTEWKINDGPFNPMLRLLWMPKISRICENNFYPQNFSNPNIRYYNKFVLNTRRISIELKFWGNIYSTAKKCRYFVVIFNILLTFSYLMLIFMVKLIANLCYGSHSPGTLCQLHL